jgi:hypothetical protein
MSPVQPPRVTHFHQVDLETANRGTQIRCFGLSATLDPLSFRLDCLPSLKKLFLMVDIFCCQLSLHSRHVFLLI